MLQLSGGADLALEATDGVEVVQLLFADDLHGDDTAELPVLGLEDLTHAALAQFLQQDVGAEQQFGAPAAKELIHLIRRQPASPDQLAGQGAWFGGGAQQGL